MATSNTITYDDFLKRVKPEMLDAQGKFKGPNDGVNFALEGLTPQEAYASATDTSMNLDIDGSSSAIKHQSNQTLLDPTWKPGPNNGGGFVGGLGSYAQGIWDGFRTNPALMAAAGGAILSGMGVSGFTGEATGEGFSGVGAAEHGFSAGADTGLVAPGSSAAYQNTLAGTIGATPSAMTAGTGVDVAGIPTTATGAGGAAGAAGATSASVSPAATEAVSAAKSGMSVTDLLSKYGPSVAKYALSALGPAAQAAAARSATSQQMDAINQSADIVAPAYTQAAKIQADAQTAASQGLAAGYTKAGDLTSAADLQAAALRAAGYSQAGQLGTQGLQGASKETQNTLDSQLALQKPYQQAGMGALNTLSEGLKTGGQFNKAFSTDDMKNVMPAFTFARDQGLAAMKAQMAAGGQNLSSNAIQGAGTLAEGLASQYEGQAFNQWLSQNNLTLGALQQMVGTGQISTGQLANALATSGVSQAGIQTAIGQVQGQAAIGASGAQATGVKDAGTAQANAALGSANAISSGQVGAANATASGVLGNAGTLGNAKLQSGNVGAAGTANNSNLISSGVTDLGKQIAGSSAWDKIFGGSSNSTATATPSVSAGARPDDVAALAAKYPAPVDQTTSDVADWGQLFNT